MKKIIKGTVPAWFEQWKQDFKTINGREAHYKGDFSTDDADGKKRRHALKKQLVLEQGSICCYCMKRISLNNSHIEHFWPKAHFQQMDMDYNNLFASCNSEGDSGGEEHCGHKKHDWYIPEMISPAEGEVEKIFTYSVDGTIGSLRGSSKSDVAQQMIHYLGLDSFHLERNRREAIQSSEVFDEVDYTEDQIREFIDYYSEMDNGEYIPYCKAIIDCLKNML